MNLVPSINNLRGIVSYEFFTLRMRALRDRFWKRLLGVDLGLPVFSEQDRRISPSRKLIGVREIPVAEIVGTLNRDGDFDSQFRPLKKHILNRWVDAYIMNEQTGWSPITVHKLGYDYFVEDGHHRVSVARSIGTEFIEAKVWEYEIRIPAVYKCLPTCCMKSHPSRAYAMG